MNRTYGFSEVTRLIGVTRNKLIYWTQAGLITASVREAHGTGHHRVFDFANLMEITVAGVLARYGMALAGIGHVLAEVRKAVRQPPDQARDQLIFVMGDPKHSDGIWTGRREEFAAELDTAFLVHEPVGILIDVGRITRELRQRTGGTA